jgi:hypothetical protein
MPDEEEMRQEQGRTSELPEQPEGEARRDEAVGEARSVASSEPPEAPGEPEASPVTTSTERGRHIMPTVSSRTEQFLIAKQSGPLPQGLQPFDLRRLEQALKAGDIILA